MKHEGVHVNFASDLVYFTLQYTSEKKISSLLIFTFILIKPLTKKSYINLKIEAVKHLYTVFLLTAEQCQSYYDVTDVQSDYRATRFILMSFKVM